MISPDKPLFGDVTSKVIDLVEGEPAAVNVSALPNPSEITYEWTRNSYPFNVIDSLSQMDPRRPTRMHSVGSVLNISKVSRQDSGYYTVKATNSEGVTEVKIQLNVFYMPR